MTHVAKIHPHGTANRYESNGCRCDACKRARYQYTTRKRAGAPTSRDRVPADVVSTHLKDLLAHGWTAAQIATVAGYRNKSSIYERVNARRWTTLDRTTADRLLAVTPETLHLAAAAGRITPQAERAVKGGLRVDAAPTTRRLRALAHAGWSPFAIARETGISKSELYKIRAASRTECSAEIADRVRDAFDTMLRHHRTNDPRSQRLAAAEGWHTTGAWADLEAGTLDEEAAA